MATDNTPKAQSSGEDSDDARNQPEGRTTEPRAPESGIQGPEGPLDDQPQREDEYLSSMLKEFNPQRKDDPDAVPDAGRAKEIKPGGAEPKEQGGYRPDSTLFREPQPKLNPFERSNGGNMDDNAPPPSDDKT